MSQRYVFLCLLAVGKPGMAGADPASDGSLRPSSLLASEPPPGVRPPAVIEQQQPPYPAEALPLLLRGDVTVAVTLDATGAVSAVELAHGAAPALDRVALETASRWRFAPAARDGIPVPSRIQLVFHFEPPSSVPANAPASPAFSHRLPGERVEGPPARSPVPEWTRAVGSPAPASGDEVRVGPPDPAAIDVSVVGRRPVSNRGASDFRIRVAQLADIPRANASELLRLAPGILLTNEGGEGHAEQVFLRGFDAREGQDIEFSANGVPINEAGNLHGNGYADTHFIIPELVDGLRVVEGPFDPRQGNFAVAGSASYDLGLEARGLTAKYTTGSWGSRRLLLLWGPEGDSRHTFGGVEIFASDGFGQNRDSRRASAMGQYEGTLGARGTYRVAGTAYATDYHSAGVLRVDDFASGRIGFFDTYDFDQGGDASRFSLSADLESRQENAAFSQQIFAISRGMGLRENFTGFLLDVQGPLQTPHGQRGDLLDLEVSESTLGARGAARLEGELWRQRQAVEVGYFARGDVVTATQQRIEAATRAPYLTEAALDSRIADVGAYLDLDLRPLRWLSLRGGIREDLFTFNIDNLCAVKNVAHPSPANPPGDASCFDQENLGNHREPNQRSTTGTIATLPRGSVLIEPVRGLSLSISAGMGARSVDPIYVSQDIKTPFASVKAYEVGAAYTGSTERLSLVARSALFRTHVDKDLIFSETAGRNVLGVGTTRTGVMGALRLTGSFFDQSANITVVRATFDDTHLLVAYVPDLVVRSDTALHAPLPLRPGGTSIGGRLGVGITFVGPRALPYGDRSDAIFVVDGQASVGWRNLTLSLTATNLLDRRYRLGELNYPSDFRLNTQSSPTLVPVRHFTAGAPRGMFVSVSVTLGGG